MIIGMPIAILALICHAIAALAIFGMFLLCRRYWSRLPERIPIHFGFDGKPDRWGSKQSSLVLPIIGLSLFGIFIWISYFAPIDPSPNPEKTRAFVKLVMGLMNVEITLLLLWSEWWMLNAALNKVSGMWRWFVPAALTIIFTTIFLLIKATPHFTS